MILELINPSDPITFEAPDRLVAAAVALLLGGGHYPVNDEAGQQVVPLFLFGGMTEWFEEQFGDFTDALTQRREEVAVALDSVTVARPSEYRAIIAAITGGDVAKGRAAYCESQRTSMNNICGRAQAYAAKVRALPSPEATS